MVTICTYNARTLATEYVHYRRLAHASKNDKVRRHRLGRDETRVPDRRLAHASKNDKVRRHRPGRDETTTLSMTLEGTTPSAWPRRHDATHSTPSMTLEKNCLHATVEA
uniref:Uncharacterized protein n=1 Tax=Angiostrongylus cantonensis TaxID=6313 RepID=A0A0K0D8V3_ANGCA